MTWCGRSSSTIRHPRIRSLSKNSVTPYLRENQFFSQRLRVARCTELFDDPASLVRSLVHPFTGCQFPGSSVLTITLTPAYRLMRLTIKTPPHYSLHQLIISHGWASLAPFGHNEERNELTYVDRLVSGRVLTYRMLQPRKHVVVEVSSHGSDAERREIRKRLVAMLQIKADFSRFYEIARSEPKLKPAVAAGKGRMLRAPTVFEDLVKTILTTNTTWNGTIRMVAKLVQRWGDPIVASEKIRAFPTPAVLAEVPVEELQKGAGLGYRAPHIQKLSRQISDGDLNLEAFRRSRDDTPALRKQLLAIDGVGPYAAASMLMLLGRYDHLPIDSWALKLVSHEWHDGKPVKPADVERVFERWGEWKGLTYWFWDWKYLYDSMTGE